MKKQKIKATALAAVLGLSALSLGFYGPEKAAAQTAYKKTTANYIGTTVDLGVANDEKLIEMLKKEGKLAKNATTKEADQALKAYLKGKAEGNKKAGKDKLPKGLSQLEGKEDIQPSNGLTKGNGNKLGQAKKNKVDSVEKKPYTGNIRNDKVLVLAIDFPDYKQSSITKEETDMFYEDYTHDHFQNMIFGKNGYKGPNGENLISMKQYYEQQSGGSYTVDGTVAGWYTADHEASYYGGNYPGPDDSDARARTLVYEALTKAGQDPAINLSEYDVWDRDDYDGDGVYNEADGIIDHLMVIHAGVGEEAGGGTLGSDAIWSHRSNLGNLIAVPNASSTSDRFGGKLAAYDYTIEPEDGAAGVFAHEFGHDLGLPDEYDTNYSGGGEAVAYWSIMASGSWAGDVPGTEPSGFSPYAKEYLQAAHGGNWLTGTTLDIKDITSSETELLLDEAATKGTNNDAVRINLPNKETTITTPASGKYAYFSGKGDELDHSMKTTLNLTNAKSAVLTFKTWYDIETDWDYASIKVNGESIKGSITTTTDPYAQNPGNGITGSSNGWVDASFDLSAYAGKEVELEFNYWTDVAASYPGFYVDDIKVVADNTNVLIEDDAEGDSAFTLNGFKKDEGKMTTERYYLLEWRSQNGVDEGLAHIRRGTSLMSYDPGLVVWYVDDSYDNNWTGSHPGDGYLGVVDADQHANYWSDKTVGTTRYQLNDAAFSLDKSSKLLVDYSAINGLTLKDNVTKRTPLFDDSADYSNPGNVEAGRNIPDYGLKVRVIGESVDGTAGKILLFK